ncbi:tRNA lysidine(34) synthetase TilS [Parapontixanthobacter aurantiacus]|uniref:tRNA lysidine(34) synthetase TilS n=1 Tax=Parapontixanthobacter aurantiacus TaxID=1463599 RepID=UPI001EEDEA38|nr:tRNA lysidine(34) synthetase TilS [Parapontixanthobacter aurantiacus]
MLWRSSARPIRRSRSAGCLTSIGHRARRCVAIDKAIDPALTRRFAADLDALWHERSDCDTLGVAVSGGPDSLALMLLANEVLRGKIEVASVDHGLRAESADEVRFVAEICEKLGIGHSSLTIEVAPGNLQAEARRARYDALSHWVISKGLAALATAHHADDQVETLVMRLNRGSGLGGLAGIRPRTVVPGSGVTLMRPLLGWRKAELEALVRASGLKPVRDPSNEDDSFDRVEVRKALADADWIDAEAWSRSAAHLAEALQFVEDQAKEDFAANVLERGEALAYVPRAPSLVVTETVVAIMANLGASITRREAAMMAARLGRGENASMAGILVTAERSANDATWLFRPEPPRRTG